jgi:hypothetical protein
MHAHDNASARHTDASSYDYLSDCARMVHIWNPRAVREHSRRDAVYVSDLHTLHAFMSSRLLSDFSVLRSGPAPMASPGWCKSMLYSSCWFMIGSSHTAYLTCTPMHAPHTTTHLLRSFSTPFGLLEYGHEHAHTYCNMTLTYFLPLFFIFFTSHRLHPRLLRLGPHLHQHAPRPAWRRASPGCRRER